MDIEMELYQCEAEWSELTKDVLTVKQYEAILRDDLLFQWQVLGENSDGEPFDLERFKLLVRNTYELFLPYYLNPGSPLPQKYLMVVDAVLDFAITPYISLNQSIARRIAQALCDRLNVPAVRKEWLVPEEPTARADLRPGFLPVECPDGDVVELSLDSFDLTELREGRDRWWRQNGG